MKAYFQKLYGYNQWANLGLSQHLQAFDDVPEHVLKLIHHLVAAEEIWFHRIAPLGFESLPLFEFQSWEILSPRLEDSATLVSYSFKNHVITSSGL